MNTKHICPIALAVSAAVVAAAFGQEPTEPGPRSVPATGTT
jgi:hypothetical protein